MKKILDDDDRKYGVKGGPKYSKRMASAKVQERQCYEMHYGTLDQEANAHIHFCETDLEAKGFNVGPKFPIDYCQMERRPLCQRESNGETVWVTIAIFAAVPS